MAKVYDLSGKATGEAKLPPVFNTPVRHDVIKKAVVAAQANKRQRYGTDPRAGKKSSAHYHGKRHYRWSMMNKELARIARIHGKVGYMALRARVVPQAVKGRRAHPPTVEKNWEQKINRKEGLLALRSAIAATASLEYVKARGHNVENAPIIIVDEFENVKKSKEILDVLGKIIGKAEMERYAEKKIRAGKGKARGRRYKKKAGILIVTSKDCDLLKAARNVAGVSVATAKGVSCEMLAPGTMPGRLTVFTKASLDEIEKRFE